MTTAPSIYIIPPVLSLLIGVALAAVAVFKAKLKTENTLFALVCLWWTLLAPIFIGHHLITDESRILTMERGFHFFYVYLPAVNLLFFYHILGIRRPRVVVGAFLFSFVISLFTPTEYYISGLHKYSWGYIARGGAVFQVFGIGSMGVLAHCVYCCIYHLRRETNPTVRLKITYMLLSFCTAGVLTILNIPAINGIDLYPAGNFSFIALAILGYGMLKHRLMDVRSMLHLTLFWGVVSSLIVVPNFIAFEWLYPRLSDFPPAAIFLFLLLWLALNMAYALRVQPKINRAFYKGRDNLKQNKIKFFEEISPLKNLDDLVAAATRLLRRALPIPVVEVYVRKNSDPVFRNRKGEAFHIDPDSEQALLSASGIIERNLMAGTPDPVAHRLFTAPGNPEGFYCLIPLVQDQRLLGIIFLSEKANYQQLSVDEIRFLHDIQWATAVALYNSQMYQNISNLKDTLQQQTHTLQNEIAERETAERALRDSEKKYRLLADNVRDVIWILEIEQRRFRYVSPSVERMRGYTPREAMALSLDETLTPESLALAESLFLEQLEKENSGNADPDRSQTLELEHYRKDGTTLWTEVTVGFLRDGKGQPTDLLGVTRDITERHRATVLQQAKSEAEEANRAKSEFLANMSHELRTPLNHIIGFTELVVDKIAGELNPTQEEYLGDVLHSSRHLLSLINDILDLSKVESGKMELVPASVDIRDLLEKSLAMFSEKALEHDIALAIEVDGIPGTISADPRKLKQIIYNLLSNAVKFTPDGGKVTLKAGTLRGDNPANAAQVIEIGVTDTGIGIQPQDQERVFQVFEQVEQSADRNYEGTGLGLPLTRRLVELHGGRIRVESNGRDQGCRFSFQIPANSGVRNAP